MTEKVLSQQVPKGPVIPVLLGHLEMTIEHGLENTEALLTKIECLHINDHEVKGKPANDPPEEYGRTVTSRLDRLKIKLELLDRRLSMLVEKMEMIV